MSIKDAVHSNQSSTVWQVEIPCLPRRLISQNVFRGDTSRERRPGSSDSGMRAVANLAPGGANELSPALQRWESDKTMQVPEGRPISTSRRTRLAGLLPHAET